MTDDAKFGMVIRINTIGGIVLLGMVAMTVGLLLVGALPWDARAIVGLVFGLVLASLAFLTARSAKQDRADPAGVESRFETGALAWSAVLLGTGLVVVVGIVVAGLLS